MIVIAILAYLFFAKENVKIKIGIFTVIILGLSYLIYSFLNLYNQIEPMKIKKPSAVISDRVPKIIGIYPNNIFGLNQKEGLIKSLNDKNNLDIIHLDFLTYKEMKSEKFGNLLDSLKVLLEKENIIAVAGPPITEIADDALEKIEEK